MIGRKIEKIVIQNEDGSHSTVYDTEQYRTAAEWCNTNRAVITDKGEYFEVEEIAKPTLAELKTSKLVELKTQRDTAEVLPIEYNGNSYDYDEKARDRINAAIIALELQGEEATIEWTLADNGTATVTAADLKAVIAAVAFRSNKLHIAYRTAKEKVEAAKFKEDLDTILLEVRP